MNNIIETISRFVVSVGSYFWYRCFVLYPPKIVPKIFSLVLEKLFPDTLYIIYCQIYLVNKYLLLNYLFYFTRHITLKKDNSVNSKLLQFQRLKSAKVHENAPTKTPFSARYTPGLNANYLFVGRKKWISARDVPF